MNFLVRHVFLARSPAKMMGVYATQVAIAAIMRGVHAVLRRGTIYHLANDAARNFGIPVNLYDGRSSDILSVRPEETRILVGVFSGNFQESARGSVLGCPLGNISMDTEPSVMHPAHTFGESGLFAALDRAYKIYSHFRSSMIKWLGRRESGFDNAPRLLTTTLGGLGKGT